MIPDALGCTILAWSYLVFQNFSHCPAKSAGLYRLTVGVLTTRFVSPTVRLWGTPIKWLWKTGYWSSGQRLSDPTPSHGHPILDDSSVPEYLVCPSPSLFSNHLSLTFRPISPLDRQCGGAQQRARPKTLKRRRRRADRTLQAGPSNHTGAQTAKKRKPGSRVAKDFGDDGKTLNDGTPGDPGTGFRKRTQR